MTGAPSLAPCAGSQARNELVFDKVDSSSRLSRVVCNSVQAFKDATSRFNSHGFLAHNAVRSPSNWCRLAAGWYSLKIITPILSFHHFPRLPATASTSVLRPPPAIIFVLEAQRIISLRRCFRAPSRQALCCSLKKKQLQELLEYMLGPDFPTGGIIMGNIGAKNHGICSHKRRLKPQQRKGRRKCAIQGRKI